jgi:hypothetical protein
VRSATEEDAFSFLANHIRDHVKANQVNQLAQHPTTITFDLALGKAVESYLKKMGLQDHERNRVIAHASKCFLGAAWQMLSVTRFVQITNL